MGAKDRGSWRRTFDCFGVDSNMCVRYRLVCLSILPNILDVESENLQ